jgi:hypothetical protein
MKNIFDTNSTADEAVFGGEPAARAVGLPTAQPLPGTLAPGGSNDTGRALLEQYQAQTDAMAQQRTAPAESAGSYVGFNPDTKQVFSAGKVFALDLNEGVKNASLLDQNNDELPAGFRRVASSDIKGYLQREYDNLGMVDSMQRRVGQAAANYGSTLQDIGAESAGAFLQSAGNAQAARNPSKINTAADIIDKPGTTISEAVGELGYDIPVAIGTTALGAAAGAKVGAAFAPVTGGLSIPLGAVLGGLTARFLPTLFETYGSVRTEQRAKGIDAKGAALAAGTGSAALEALFGPEARLGTAVAKKTAQLAGKEFLEKGAAKSARDLLTQGQFKRGATRAARDFGIEGGTEVVQTGMERLGAFDDLTSADALDEFAIAGVKGGIGGAAASPLASYAEFRDAKNFVESLQADMALAADTTVPSAVRLQSARRVQDVLRGSSEDPQFNQQLGEFRQKLGFIDTEITRLATQQALADGTPVNLMDTAPQGDMFNRVTESVPEAAPEETGVPIQQTDPNQGSLFDETGTPTYSADPSFTMTQGEADASFQGPTLDTPQARFAVQAANLNDQLSGLGALPTNPVQVGGVTGALTPLQRGALQPPARPAPAASPAIGGLDFGALAAEMDAIVPPALVLPTPSAAVEQAAFGRQLSSGGPSPATLSSPAAQAAGGVFSAQQVADDLGLNELESRVASQPGAVTGKIAATQRTLKGARDLLLNPDANAQVEGDAVATNIARAARAYAKAYSEFENAFSNIQRFADPLKGEATSAAAERANRTVTRAETAAATTRQALADLGAAAGNSPQDVQALVKLIKDAVQPMVAGVNVSALSPADKQMYDAYKRLDTAFGRGWTAAKQDQFLGATDLFVSRATDTRPSREAAEQGLAPQLVRAATDGYGNPNETAGPADIYKGFLGVLQYIRHHGTGYDKALARAIRESMLGSPESKEARVEAKKNVNLPKVKFSQGGKSRFDPKTNTVYIRETDSPSVVLHEALHAALQHFVYANPNDPIVVELKKSVKAIIGYKGGLGDKANQVQQLLKNLVQEGNELDAVLELMSYGNTLNEFRKALDGIPTKGTPKTFYTAVKDVWTYTMALIRRLTGAKNNTEAANVINRTWELLAKSGEAPVGGKRARVGNVLNVEVMGGMNPVTAPQADLLQRPGASLPSGADVARFNKRVLPTMVSSKVLFDLLGWGRLSGALTKQTEKLANFVREDFPGVAKWVTYLHAQFNVPHELRNTFQRFKNDKQAGYKVAERLANFIQYQPADKVTGLFAYLDGNKSALKDDVAMRELADDVKAWRDFYVQELGDTKAKEFFSRGKFSETMLFVTKRSQVAGSGFGVRKLSTLLGQKSRTEETLEEGWLNLDNNGDPVLDDQRFLQVLQLVNGVQVPAGFIAESKFAADGDPAGFTVDPTYLWYHTSKGKGGHRFVANMTAKQALAENKAEDLANALRNTMSALSSTYAAKHFSDSIANYGAGEDGVRDATSVVFDSIEQANKVLGIKINSDTVITGDSDDARSKAIGHAYRNARQWIRVPKGGTYGAMAGKIVKASVWSAMTDMSDRKPVIELLPANTAMRWFKKSKTIYNPGTHLTNVATNVTLAMMHDIPFGTVLAAGKMFVRYETSPNAMSAQDRALVRAFMNSNAMLGDFSSTEVKEAISNAMLLSLNDKDGKAVDPNSTMGRVSAFMQMEKNKAQAISALSKTKKFAGHADNIVTEIYSAEDNIFRLAMFLKTAADISAQTGKAPTQADLEQAGNIARAAFLDYDIDAKAVRIARQTVLPFVSWAYAVTPLIGRMAVHQPWKIANVLLAYTVMEHILQEIGGGDDEDERLRSVAPEYIRERMFGGFGPFMHVRLPFLGDDKNPVYYRLGDYIPMASLARGQGPNAFMGIDWWPSFASPTGPFVSTILALVGGVDPFMGKPLSPPTDTAWEKFVDRAKYMGGQFTPNIPLVNPTTWSKVDEIVKGRSDRSENYGALQMARYAGLKMYDYNVDQAVVAQGRAYKAIMGEYQREIGTLRRAEARFENPDWEAFRTKQDELLVRMREELKKLKGEE